MDSEPKGYTKLYLYTLIEMLIAIMLVLFSQALDINAEKYYGKLFVIGVILFFYDAAVIISHGKTHNLLHAEFKEISKTVFSDSPLFGKIFQIAYPVLGLAASIYIMISEKWYLAAGFAKISVAVTCAFIALRGLISLIIPLFKIRSRDEFSEAEYVKVHDADENAESVVEKQPFYIFIVMILVSGLIGSICLMTFMHFDFYDFTSEYKVVNGLKNNKVKKMFTEDYLNTEVNFSLASGQGDDYFYYMYSDQRDRESFVKDTVGNILKRALAEDVEFIFVDSNETYTFKDKEIKELLSPLVKNGSDADVESEMEVEPDVYFVNDISDKEKLHAIAESIYESGAYVILDTKNTYGYQYIPTWDIPSYCELSGINMEKDGWQDELEKKEPFFASVKEVFEMICNDPDYENCHGLLLDFGTDAPLLIPHNTLCDVWKEKNPVELDSLEESAGAVEVQDTVDTAVSSDAE
ncbi:MAG: hypothetical protein IJM22_00365 [Treponema sp.]|nr:hypothetical protein [Treponema sp.]